MAFRATWEEGYRQLSSVEPRIAIAWLGLMAKVIQECSPLILSKNSTNLWFGSGGSALSVTGVLDRLKRAAVTASEQMLADEERKRGSFEYISDFRQTAGLADPGMEALKERWKSYWKANDGFLSTSALISGGAAFLLF
jgi:hypothetical protein